MNFQCRKNKNPMPQAAIYLVNKTKSNRILTVVADSDTSPGWDRLGFLKCIAQMVVNAAGK
jgi:hypothetical protein